MTGPSCDVSKLFFLTCAGPDAVEPLKDLPKVLHDYVSRGGTLYASDLRYDTVVAAFSEVRDRASIALGVPQELRGDVISPELRDLVGPVIPLQFKSERRRPAAFRGDDVSILIKGELKTTAGAPIDAPLAVRFPIGKGTVIFTSFHSEGRVSGVEAKLLKFLVLKAVTSVAEVRLTDALADAGFATRAIAATAASAGEHPAYHTYQHETTGALRFSLDPARPGARLRLEVVDPNGKTTTKRGESTLTIELATASPGRWQFRASAESTPYPSFPAVVALGTSGDPSDSTSARMNRALVATGGNVRFELVNLGNKNVVKQARPLRIAVSEPRYDDMGKLLRALGDGYRYTQVKDEVLIRPKDLDPFDVFFLTCNGWPTSWTSTVTNEFVRPGLGRGEFRPEILELIKQTLNRFVRRGGTLYVSDLQYAALVVAFPDRTPKPDLDLKRLPAIESAEKHWLELAVPQAEAKTVAQTVDTLKLSENLLARRDELLAVVHTSVLINMDRKLGYRDDLEAILTRTAKYGVSATQADCEAIADAFGRRRIALIDAHEARGKKIKKITEPINKAASTLHDMRVRLLINYDGREKQSVNAVVVDSGLQEAIGAAIRLRFPDNEWLPGRFTGDDVQVLIRGTYKSVDSQWIEAPLLVRFQRERGTVIFTSFHNEAQNNQQELELLRYLVFSAVTAKEEALTQQTMLSGGFSPVKQGQVNHAVGLDSIAKTYQSTSGDPLRFSLNFGGGGATLRLTLVAPGGAKRDFETNETILVEATGAPAGEWLYSVTAVRIPYQNFAYSVSIGKGTAASPGTKR